MRILVIEDEAEIADTVKQGLEEAHYWVDVAYTGSRGLNMALGGDYSLIILDLMLPEIDGWQICDAIRSRRRTIPILMLTARDTIPDRVRGLEIGADDYLLKPFDFDELLARVRALLRRDRIHKTRVIRVGDLEIDTALNKVTRAGKEIQLTRREYTLLEALASREGQILSRERILDQVWMEEDVYSNTVDVYIAKLRKKIDGEYPVKLIHTVHGLGYVLRPPVSEEKP